MEEHIEDENTLRRKNTQKGKKHSKKEQKHTKEGDHIGKEYINLLYLLHLHVCAVKIRSQA